MKVTLAVLMVAAGTSFGIVNRITDSIGDEVAFLVAVSTALAALVYIAKTGRRALRGLVKFYRRIDAMIDLTDSELKPNGGGSIKDAVEAIRRDVRRNAGNIESLDHRVAGVEERLDHHLGEPPSES